MGLSMTGTVTQFPSACERLLRRAERNGQDTSLWMQAEIDLLVRIADQNQARQRRVEQLAMLIERSLDANPDLAKRWGFPTATSR